MKSTSVREATACPLEGWSVFLKLWKKVSMPWEQEADGDGERGNGEVNVVVEHVKDVLWTNEKMLAGFPAEFDILNLNLKNIIRVGKWRADWKEARVRTEWWWTETWGGKHNTVYRWGVIELCTWILCDLINKHQPNKLNLKRVKAERLGTIVGVHEYFLSLFCLTSQPIHLVPNSPTNGQQTALGNNRFIHKLTFLKSERLSSVGSVRIDVNSSNCDISLSCWGSDNASSSVLYTHPALAVRAPETAEAQPVGVSKW